jgi:hypothetical protein
MKSFALAAALLIMPAGAQAASPHSSHHHLPHQARGSYAYQPQIACTQVGCLPVPRGCYPAGGRTLSDMPSGFDVMVCPGGDRYGHR